MKELLTAIGLGLVVLLPLANPLTTVALFLGSPRQYEQRRA
ncbi:hypothetical protein ACNKHQ_09100 [Shigella flexneri]